MRRDVTDQELFLQSMVNHPCGRDAPGRHRRPDPGPEPTPLEVMQDHRMFRVVEGILAAVGAVGVLALGIIVAQYVFMAVMSLW